MYQIHCIHRLMRNHVEWCQSCLLSDFHLHSDQGLDGQLLRSPAKIMKHVRLVVKVITTF